MATATPETTTLVRDVSVKPEFVYRMAAFTADVREMRDLGIAIGQQELEVLAERHDVPVPILETENTPEGRAASAARIQGRIDARAKLKADQIAAYARACAATAARSKAEADARAAKKRQAANAQTEKETAKLAAKEQAEEARCATRRAFYARR